MAGRWKAKVECSPSALYHTFPHSPHSHRLRLFSPAVTPSPTPLSNASTLLCHVLAVKVHRLTVPHCRRKDTLCAALIPHPLPPRLHSTLPPSSPCLCTRKSQINTMSVLYRQNSPDEVVEKVLKRAEVARVDLHPTPTSTE